MTKYLLLLLTSGLLFTTHSFSQTNPPTKTKGSVKGALIDTSEGKHQPLSNATVGVLADGADSTTEQFVVSDKKGSFWVRGLKPAKYHILVTYEGYQPVSRTFTVPNTGDSSMDINLSTLFTAHADNMLEAVVIQRPPMGVRKDTVEYNASMFAVKPNAVAEDLLKKFPGIQVDKSGNITAQGETVTRVMVDGKRFFGDDPKLATRNLPPDIIDKIQVFDDLSDQSKFSGFDDGNRVKTINIVTKKGSRKGYFGKAVAGAGTNEDYDESINLHRFDGNQQISLLGQANDVNKQNFTPRDILGGSGGSGGRRGGGGGGGGFGGGGGPSASTSPSSTGVTTVWAGGANYRNSFGGTDLTASYFYNNQHISLSQSDSSLSPISDTSGKIVSGHSWAVSKIENHQVVLNLESKIDSNNSLVFRPNIAFQKSTPFGNSDSYTTDEHGVPALSQTGHTSSMNQGFNINGSNLTFRHRFGKPGRTLTLDVNGTVNVNNGEGYNYSVNTQYRKDSLPTVFTINQHYNDSLHSVNLSPTLSYTEPLGKHMNLQLSYNHGYTRSTTINNTYAYNEASKDYSQFDSLFSNSYKFRSNSDQVSMAWRIAAKNFNLSAGSGVQWTNFNSDNTTKGITVAHNYVNLTPTVAFLYNFSSTEHFRLFYNGRTGTPSPSQLQPLTTTSDSINFSTGNPNLKPQFTHSLRMLYAHFDPSTQKVIFATINASTIVNDIQSIVYYRPGNLGTVSSYTNLNGTYNINGYFNYGFPLKSPKSNMNLITNFGYTQSQTLRADNEQEAALGHYTHLYTKNTTLGETISWTTNIKKNFDMNLSAASTYTIPTIPGAGSGTSSKDSSGAKVNQNLNSFSETLGAEFTAYTNNGWLIAATFDYIYTYTHSKTFNASVPLFTPSIAKQLFKKKNGELRLTVFDVLNKNTSVSKTVGALGAVSYQRSNVLSRYAMLTFTYNLNNFAGANQRRMPGFFPGRFRDGGGMRGGGGGFQIP